VRPALFFRHEIRHPRREGRVRHALQRRDRSLDTYTYMPTPADPFTTTITLLRGRVYEIERAHKF
jgi:hypothetical protein